MAVWVKLGPGDVSRASPILEAVGRLAREGALVVYPTDTVYGVGSNPLDENAVQRVFRAKGRPPGKPVPVLASGLEAVERIAVVGDAARVVAEAFWPGGLTLVLPARPAVPCIVTACSGWVGVRVPGHPVVQGILRGANGLIVGTSANRSGRPSPRTAEEAHRELGEAVDVYVDSGPAPGGRPSTVVRLEEEGGLVRLVVERRGLIPVEKVTRILEERGFRVVVMG